MARHLASCPKCTEWARRALELDQAWEATRPAEPGPDVFDSVWASVCRRLDAAEHEPQTVLFPRRRSWVAPVKALVRVAAVLVVAGIVLVQFSPRVPQGGAVVKDHGAPTPGTVVAATLPPMDVPVSGEELMVIKIEGEKLVLLSVAPAEGVNPTLVAGNFEMLGPLETMGQ
jgi:hypothetical protein